LKNKSQKIIFITGASSGIGLACARYLSEQGYVVFGSGRTKNKQQVPYHHLQMDVTNQASIRAAVQCIYDKAGRIDLLINNAGTGIAGSVADTSVEEAQQQFDTNFFGVLRVCQEVVPQMKTQGQGMIINMSSIGGLIGLPYQGLYCASKFALEGASRAMRMELTSYNIKVVLINPGDFQTSFSANRSIIRKYLDAPPAQFSRTLATINKDEQNGGNPEKIARLIEKIIWKRNPKTNYMVGSLAEIVFARLMHILPAKVTEGILSSHYKLGV